MKVLVPALACLALTGCGSSDPVPEVDWSKVPAFQRDLVDEAIKEKDCMDLEGLSDEIRREDVRAYLAWQLRHDACY